MWSTGSGAQMIRPGRTCRYNFRPIYNAFFDCLPVPLTALWRNRIWRQLRPSPLRKGTSGTAAYFRSWALRDPQGLTRSLKNPDNVPPELFEIQSGSYLEPDDIVWFKDQYNRAPH
ncbi:hypothetical protein JH271_03360 [Xanthomonas campestris pv. campestris]|uniref:hypothetical protein n=2 Tax=Xanthomonas campestris TaxID=339 RepID=UPI0005DE044F|nr:hypothetical protein [Xanthomonas campestris]MCF8820838.1 hypothetical protein [Xanthomonas campestris pv. campestris]MCF8828795.1 hypothetical protein [Xanthomonas campestris pv. campestris]MCF8832813.1 hypothetical protein [Xanthomonas campestris pv. campestris]MCF8841724.1 hypothetical protein [Xanthomonas campestris pv. campestris]MCF8859198.1 hypothetical protein [Xanthomonas campestris pv. campestris]